MTTLIKKSTESINSPSISIIYIDNKSCLLISKFTDFSEINFNLIYGDLKIKLLFGNLNINEYNLECNKLIDVYADKDNQLYCKIQFNLEFNLIAFKNWLVKQNFNKYILKEIQQLKLQSINSCYMVLYALKNEDPLHLKYSYLIGKNLELDWLKIEQKDDFIQLKDEWKDQINKLENELNDNQQSTKIVMCCGGKNSGKSTLIRHLINRQLNQQKTTRKIYYLDLDPGQSEFTNSGQLSLIEINKPLLFPTYFNVNKFHNQIILSCSVSSANVEDLGRLYSENLRSLWLKIKQILKSDDLLFVNTMGFVRIIGFMMLVDAIRLIKPTYLIEIRFNLNEQQKNLYDINYQVELTFKNLKSIKGWIDFDLDRLKLNYQYLQLNHDYILKSKNSKLKRVQSQLVYLSSIDNLLERPLNHLEPFSIKFKDVKIYLAIENQPEESLILNILNCSWIQLCKLEEENCKELINENKIDNFKLIKQFGSNECLGNAFIRNIDIRNKLFYILTPECLNTIKKVNCFVKPNSINVPKEIFIPQLVYSNVKPMYIDVKF